MNAIEFREVRKSYGDKGVLRETTFAVAPGELVGFVGPNGAGKSTCLRILLGLTSRDSGEARVLGMDAARDSLRIRQNCCYLPGENSVYLGMRGRDFLRFALGFHPEHQQDIMADMIQAFALPLQKKVRSYSAGMKQKLALMATLIPDVEVYVLDEPDRALDATTRFFIRDLLRKLHGRGKTILLSSHHLREIEAITERLIFIMDGRVIDQESIAGARRELGRRIRLRLKPGTAVPGGARQVREDPDGVSVYEPDGDPLKWLARLPGEAVDSVELGSVRLEDLYRALIGEEQA